MSAREQGKYSVPLPKKVENIRLLSSIGLLIVKPFPISPGIMKNLYSLCLPSVFEQCNHERVFDFSLQKRREDLERRRREEQERSERRWEEQRVKVGFRKTINHLPLYWTTI